MELGFAIAISRFATDAGSQGRVVLIARYHLALSIAGLALSLGYPSHAQAGEECVPKSRPRPVAPDSPYFGYRPRSGDGAYPGSGDQEKYNAESRRDVRDDGMWRQTERSDCPPPWVREEEWGYRPRNKQPTRENTSSSDMPIYPRYLPQPPLYPGPAVYGQYPGAQGASPRYDYRLYRPDPYIPKQ